MATFDDVRRIAVDWPGATLDGWCRTPGRRLAEFDENPATR